MNFYNRYFYNKYQPSTQDWKKKFFNFGLRQFPHMQSSIRLSSLHVRCSHVEFASSANQVRYHTKNRYSLTLNVSSRLTNHERDDIHENIIACIITYLAKFPRLSVLIKKSLLKKITKWTKMTVVCAKTVEIRFLVYYYRIIEMQHQFHEPFLGSLGSSSQFFLKTLVALKIISILRIFTAHLDVLNLLQSLTQGPPSSLHLSGNRRYLQLF